MVAGLLVVALICLATQQWWEALGAVGLAGFVGLIFWASDPHRRSSPDVRMSIHERRGQILGRVTGAWVGMNFDLAVTPPHTGPWS